jgi:hypothetical protein
MKSPDSYYTYEEARAQRHRARPLGLERAAIWRPNLDDPGGTLVINDAGLSDP